MTLELTLILLIFIIQWLAFVPACVFKTERFYDLTGGLTYTLVIPVSYTHLTLPTNREV